MIDPTSDSLYNALFNYTVDESRVRKAYKKARLATWAQTAEILEKQYREVL